MSRPANGKRGGKGYVRACLICRQYREKQQNTNWWCSTCRVPLCKKGRGRDSRCYEEHMQRCDDPVVGCFERESENIVLPQAYKLYKPENMANIPIIPAFDANEIMVQTMETNTADSAVGAGVQDSSDGDSNSSEDSDSDSSGELKRKCKEPAAATKKRSYPLRMIAMSRKSKRIAGGEIILK